MTTITPLPYRKTRSYWSVAADILLVAIGAGATMLASMLLIMLQHTGITPVAGQDWFWYPALFGAFAVGPAIVLFMLRDGEMR